MTRRSRFLTRKLAWAKRCIRRNIVLWTIFCFLVSTSFGLILPFLQKKATGWLEAALQGPDLIVEVCSPLQSATLIVTSSDGQREKTHSANSFPFLNKMLVVLNNNSNEALDEVIVSIRPVNTAGNELDLVNMYTDNSFGKESFSVSHQPDGSFLVSLGSMFPGQTMVFDALGLWPTAYLVEFTSDKLSVRSFSEAGSCNIGSTPESLTLPTDFYTFDRPPNDPPDQDNPFKINDIDNPIGPLLWRVQLQYDCGDGQELQLIKMGGPVEYCNIALSQAE